ncbi:Protein STIG1 [Hibiscus syriacus]|uniref:Protein STIG1 n=1 Tax=Hibiscus syriacus TaxID=106335 RepID=A0A6A3B9I4_HIBSY|nr:stigma-specific STIG1-like protein 2 [Hibiscus syriacus]KAE8713694.1 Protein STIG1 [Hibiscus syriacus]
MEFSKIIVVTLTLTFAITMAVADQSPLPSTRVNRFLQAANPIAGQHCRKDGEVCTVQGSAATSTCCSNKCVDLATDDNNCGLCNTKCTYREVCCRGECVDIAYDKRNCGACNHR